MNTALLLASFAHAQVEVEEFALDNGMTFLLVPRTEQPNNVAAGWVAHVGSVNERPGITGISHFFEHMMFKGTTTIGTRDPERDAWFRSEQERVKSALDALVNEVNYDRYRHGEITNPHDASHDNAEMAALRAELAKLMEDHREVIVKNEMDALYSAEGGSDLNAFTSEDLTFYFTSVPSNKLELWAWLESDRLTDSVFREFYSERDVVHEERRLRVESTPTGVYDEQFEAMFWTSSPYSWPVIGWPSDLNSYTMAQARSYFETYYAPNNLTGVIVGDFDPATVKPLLTEYFSRLKAGPPVPPVVTTEVPALAEKRMNVECDCPNSFQVAYHTAPAGHPDDPVLTVISSLLNGRTGRLYRNLVEGKEIATDASARPDARRYAGAFYGTAQGREGVDPAKLEAAWHAQIDRLRTEPVGEAELQKVKNQYAADAYRRLQSNLWLMIQVGYNEHLDGWELLNDEPKKVQAVTTEDVQRVVQTYFTENNRAVGHYRRVEAGGN